MAIAPIFGLVASCSFICAQKQLDILMCTDNGLFANKEPISGAQFHFVVVPYHIVLMDESDSVIAVTAFCAGGFVSMKNSQCL